MPDTDTIKRERAKLKAIMERLADMRPFVRGEARARLAGKIANAELREDAVKDIDVNIVDWSQITGIKENEELKPGVLKKAVEAYNVYKNIVGYSGKQKYEQKDVLSAWVQKFEKFSLIGVKYLGVVFSDGKKFRYIIDTPGKTDKSISKNSQHKFDTYVAPAQA